jgi:hypothetical protein
VRILVKLILVVSNLLNVCVVSQIVSGRVLTFYGYMD